MEISKSRLVESAVQDVRYAVRTLRKTPGFTAIAVLTLAIGIGATTAIYSILDTILLQPLPFPDSDRLVRIIEYVPHAVAGRAPLQRGITHQEFLDWRQRARTLSDAAAVVPMAQRMVRTAHGAAGLWGAMTSTNTFALLGTQAMLGRTLGGHDDANRDVVVLSFHTWQQHFDSNPAIVGEALEFRTGALVAPQPPRLLTVIGVLPPDFEFPTGPFDFFTPLLLDPSRPTPSVTMIARLSSDVSLEDAVREVNALGAAARPPWPPTATPPTGPRFDVQRLKDLTVRSLQPALRLLLAVAAVVLMIVCANVANLLLARGTARQREIAVRLAIGANRARIIRQMLTECVVLAAAGGVLGAMFGATGVVLVQQLTTLEAPGIFRLMLGTTILPRAHEVQVDFKVLGIAFSIAAITSIVFGLLPALHVSRTKHLHLMGAPGSGFGSGASRLRGVLVVGQLVMATVLLVAAGLLTHSFVKIATFNKGYDPANVLAFQLLFPDQYTTGRKAEAIEALLARLRAIQNVRFAGFSRHGVLIGEELMIGTFVPRGRSFEEMKSERSRVRSVSDGYLTAIGVPLLAGREFEPGDTAAAPPLIVMNRSAARAYFGGANPIGELLDWHVGNGQAQVKVIGVVEDLRQESPTDPVFPEIFVDYRQFVALSERFGISPQRQNEWAIGFLSFAIRTINDPAGAIPVVRQIVNAVDPNIGIDAIVPLNRLVASALARERFYAVMLTVFSAVAALLAAIGIYGVLAYAVAQRTQEIGIRMALGAEQGRVLALVLRKGLILTTMGIGIGVVAAVAVSRVLHGLLFGINPLDVRTFVAVAVMFAIMTMIACLVPAYRATKVDPTIALRVE